jgi:rhodanese-related sulfurtransferase
MHIPAYVIALLFLGFVIALTFVLWQVEVVSVIRMRKLLSEGAPLIDIDPPDVFEKDHPPGAINVPLRDLPGLAGQLDPNRPVVIYGHHTLSTALATRELRQRGFRVLDIGPARPDWTGW